MKEQKREVAEWKRIRSVSWSIVCGYADPKEMPSTQTEWWPMEGDAAPKTFKMTRSRKNKIAAAIKAELERGK